MKYAERRRLATQLETNFKDFGIEGERTVGALCQER